MNLPKEFQDNILSILPKEEAKELFEAIEKEPKVSIRMNPNKGQKCSLDTEVTDRVPWCKDGIYLQNRPNFTIDPFFHTGHYYVQEASSMFVYEAIKQYTSPNNPIVALDLCAAPGGKSTLMASYLPQGSLLIANEVINNRANILKENITKWGEGNVVVSNNDPADFSKCTQQFDLILTDLPCSGEGMFRKDNAAKDEWSMDNVNICWQRQRRIIADIWDSLKPGGILIYSTCTYNTLENEDNVNWIRQEYGAEILPLEINNSWNIIGNLAEYNFPVYRFMPHRTNGEGIFLAVLRKKDEEIYVERKKKNKKKLKTEKSKIDKNLIAKAMGWIENNDLFTSRIYGDKIYAIPEKYADTIDLLAEKLHLLIAGIPLAELKGKDILPLQGLATSKYINSKAFHKEDVDLETCLHFLKSEAITLKENTPKGIVLISYMGENIGFMKNIGNRANNLYPTEWRIRMKVF